MSRPESRPRLVAVLGPTNTGKTHLAIERMLGHGSGMMGFPLRLLARENYDRVVRLKGARQVALITGEERILPGHAKYFLCTVESMPLEREVDFLAVDEVQLAADAERGHVFTDRLLRARGREETMLVGAETIRPLLRRLLPDIEVITRPRFSVLSHTGPRKLTGLAPRSAVVAFSAEEVYALAELLRRRRGGTAVVMGALSPRTRNAQVAMYQAGEVDYLVATDAIGMGLNMDLRHVAFSSLAKFDGRGVRRLLPAELGQIAGRAGRYLRDGTFGTTGQAGRLDPELADAIECHRFAPLERLVWRNAGLDFRSPAALSQSLDAPPPVPELVRVEAPEDQAALAALLGRGEIAALSTTPAALRLLWQVAQIPDYRKLLSDTHVALLAGIYGRLMAGNGHLPEDWAARQVAAADRTDGDIPALTQRIAHVRTWTYISHRDGWLDDAAHWQERTRAIEDRLSDALHDRLIKRFVDYRAARLLRRRGGGDAWAGVVTQAGEIMVEGAHVGRLEGFRFVADAGAGEDAEGARTLLAAARRVLRGDIAARLRRLEDAADSAFALARDGGITWDGQAVARLVPGEAPLRPGVRALSSDLLEPAELERVRRRLDAWLAAHLNKVLRPLFAALEADLAGAARGLVYRLAENLGTMARADAAAAVAALGRGGRGRLGRLGIRLGARAVYLPALAPPPAVALRALLWSVHHDYDDPPALPAKGAASVALEPGLPGSFYLGIGFVPVGDRALRADRLERLTGELRKMARQGPFVATPTLAGTVGCTPAELDGVLRALGYRRRGSGEAAAYEPAPRRQRRPPRPTGRRGDPDSPFAKLRELDLAR